MSRIQAPVRNTFIHYSLHKQPTLRRVASSPALLCEGWKLEEQVSSTPSTCGTPDSKWGNAACASCHSEASTRCCSDEEDTWSNGSRPSPRTTHLSEKDHVNALTNPGKNGKGDSPKGLTLMMRNVPCCLSAAQLATMIEEAGFEGTYGFLYLPSYPRGNLGYAFIDMKDERDAARLVDAFNGYQFHGKSKKVCQIGTAQYQGRASYSKAFSHKSPGLYVPVC